MTAWLLMNSAVLTQLRMMPHAVLRMHCRLLDALDGGDAAGLKLGCTHMLLLHSFTKHCGMSPKNLRQQTFKNIYKIYIYKTHY